MKIAYITAKTPWGAGEAFILEEMIELKRQGIDLSVIPRNPPREIFHNAAKNFSDNAVWLPLFDFKIGGFFLKSLFLNNLVWAAAADIFRYSRSPLILAKNLAVLPKAVYTARIVKKQRIEHIHCHWGSTTATMAFAVSKLTGIPWSFTLHRWDIRENNMLAEKTGSARFVRCISEHGKKEFIGIVGKAGDPKTKVIYMGVAVPADVGAPRGDRGDFIIATPANFVEKKGHKYLIEACAKMAGAGLKNFRCVFLGAGPLKPELKKAVKERGLENYISMPGPLPHENLFEKYLNKEIDLVVLPSIIARDGDLEGIPVALMEAMAYGLPVISTDTGGIPELLSGGAGVMVKEKSSADLAAAVKKIMLDSETAEKMGRAARKKIENSFNAAKNVRALLELIKN
jgi:glycosyltransferase involved in cell wall biosynthesis